MEKISVLMSVYNDESNIEYSLESVLNQTYKNLEVLIMDDCSTDNTSKIIEQIAKKDSRINIYKNEKNKGLTHSLNLLINNSNGNYIARQDSDDFSFPERLSKQINFIKNKNLDGCTTRAYKKESFKITPRFSKYFNKKFILKLKNPFIHGSLLIKRDVILNIGGYDENFYYAQDYKLFKDLIYRNKKIKIFNEVCYVLNNENNISTNHKEKQHYYAKCVRKNIIPSNKNEN